MSTPFFRCKEINKRSCTMLSRRVLNLCTDNDLNSTFKANLLSYILKFALSSISNSILMWGDAMSHRHVCHCKRDC